ncbi:ikaros family zinc finger protein-like [Ctenocephalides felis]|uniref:ikaros family zinc finger protein-like n=1 Tax=Ctenocephalides felis TaxID=7515 RepID=UPI000E6E2051|nr:ikaros family zinc finger protein-like [Ctenocephalides felis]
MDAISKVLPTLTQTVKVSPLKSLLREDLKRRISARVHSRNANRSMEIVNTSSSAAINEHEDTLNTQWMSQGSSSGLMCLFCNINFPDQTLYFLHKGCHSESNPWKCNICGEQCNNVYEFNSHLLSKSHQ